MANRMAAFEANVMPEPNSGCWLWLGYVMKNGYGQTSRDGRHVLAHRWSWQSVHGSIPDGLVIDHLCRNRLCVNPDHLEAVSQATNVRRGMGYSATVARTDTCREGHSSDFIRLKNGKRACRPCHRLWRAAAYGKRTAAVERGDVTPVSPVGSCVNGHADAWRIRKDGRRTCRECERTRDKRRTGR